MSDILRSFVSVTMSILSSKKNYSSLRVYIHRLAIIILLQWNNNGSKMNKQAVRG